MSKRKPKRNDVSDEAKALRRAAREAILAATGGDINQWSKRSAKMGTDGRKERRRRGARGRTVHNYHE